MPCPTNCKEKVECTTCGTLLCKKVSIGYQGRFKPKQTKVNRVCSIMQHYRSSNGFYCNAHAGNATG